MRKIEFDQDVSADGATRIATHFIDLDEPAVVAMLKSFQAMPAGPAKDAAVLAAGYALVSKHSNAQAGETRLAMILRQLAAEGITL